MKVALLGLAVILLVILIIVLIIIDIRILLYAWDVYKTQQMPSNPTIFALSIYLVMKLCWGIANISRSKN